MGNPGCPFVIVPTGQSFAAAGGTGMLKVKRAVGCAWTAQSHDSWMTITAGSSGTNPGKVHYSVAPNTGRNYRVGVLNVAGYTFTIIQAGTNAN